MNIEHITVQGSNEWNEDAVIVNEQESIYGVLDGATSMKYSDGRETGGYLASQTAKRTFEAIDSAGGSLSLKQAVLDANEHIRAHMLEYGLDVNDKLAVWAAGIAVVRIGEHQIEYAQTGDCMIIAIYNNGTVRAVTHDQVDHFDVKSRLLWEQYADEGYLIPEIKERVYESIQRNRMTTNTLDGYAILNGDPDLEHFVEHGMFNRIQLKSILIVSDGLFLPHKAGAQHPVPAMSDMVTLIEEKGLAGYVDWLITNEYDEDQQGKYTRFKIADDKTAIWIHFE